MGKPFSFAIIDFSGLLNVRDDPKFIGDNEAVIAQNVVATGKGKLKKRFGYTQVSSGGSVSEGVRGLLRFDILGASAATFLCIFNDDKLFTITPSVTTFVDRGTYGTDDGERVNGTVFNNLAIFGNGNAANNVKKFDGTTLADLGGSPPKMSTFEVHKDFVFGAGVLSTPTVVENSGTQNPEEWSGTGVSGSTPISINDGDAVTRIISHEGQILVFKKKSKRGMSPVFASSITVIGDADELGFRQSEIIDRSDGAVSGNSVVVINQGIVFLGKIAFQSYGFVENFPLSRRPENLSEKIEDLVRDSINRSSVDKATAIHDTFRNVYRCAVPFGTSTNNNRELVYNLRFGSWSINTGLSVADYELFEDGDGNEEVYFGSELVGKLFKFNNLYSDNFDDDAGTGTGIEAIWRGKTYTIQNSPLGARNRFDRVVVRGRITNPFSGTFIITVCHRTAIVSSEHTISDANILGSSSVSGYVSDEYVSEGYVGDGGVASGEPTLFRFEKEIYFPDDINEGQEVFFGFQSSNDQQGFVIEQILVEGEIISGKPLTPAA